jgi:hypothetical protein
MPDLNALFEMIAQQEMRIETLETRGWDTYDFPEVPVWGLRKALQRAYDAGVQDATSRG